MIIAYGNNQKVMTVYSDTFGLIVYNIFKDKQGDTHFRVRKVFVRRIYILLECIGVSFSFHELCVRLSDVITYI